jgi:hypothetical protein
MIKNWKKVTAEKYFLDEKFQFSYPLASIKDVQTTAEAFTPSK